MDSETQKQKENKYGASGLLCTELCEQEMERRWEKEKKRKNSRPTLLMHICLPLSSACFLTSVDHNTQALFPFTPQHKSFSSNYWCNVLRLAFVILPSWEPSKYLSVICAQKAIHSYSRYTIFSRQIPFKVIALVCIVQILYAVYI